jgi:hypothetical protein
MSKKRDSRRKRSAHLISRGGDYVPPNANIVARRIFIDAVTRLVPEAIRELEALTRTLPDFDAGHGWIASVAFPQDLLDWCLRRGFTATRWMQADIDRSGTVRDIPSGPDWLLELVGHTVQVLRDPSNTDKASDILSRSISVSYAPVHAPTLANPFWNPDVETEQAFRHRVDAYILEVKQSTNAAGRRVARQAKEPIRDFEWLALYQVGRSDAVEIQARTSRPRISTDAILNSIAVAAEEASVHLRRGKRGRPRR